MSMTNCFFALTPAELREVSTAGANVDHLVETQAFGERQQAVGDSWQTIHVALGGHPSEAIGVLGKAVMGGKEVNDELGDLARILDPDEVREIAAALLPISTQRFVEMLRSRDLSSAEIYGFAPDDDVEEQIRCHAAAFEEMRRCYLRAGEQGLGMLILMQ